LDLTIRLSTAAPLIALDPKGQSTADVRAYPRTIARGGRRQLAAKRRTVSGMMAM
jgi:hypothetical protein